MNIINVMSLSQIKEISLKNPDELIPIAINKKKFLVAFLGVFGVPVIKNRELVGVQFGSINMIPSEKNKKEIGNFMEENNIVTH